MKQYRTVSGDTWDSISFKQYGDYSHMLNLLLSNKEHMETVIFSSGVVLNIPESTEKVQSSLPPWKRG